MFIIQNLLRLNTKWVFQLEIDRINVFRSMTIFWVLQFPSSSHDSFFLLISAFTKLILNLTHEHYYFLYESGNKMTICFFSSINFCQFKYYHVFKFHFYLNYWWDSNNFQLFLCLNIKNIRNDLDSSDNLGFMIEMLVRLYERW